jgi:hypothetical protein
MQRLSRLRQLTCLIHAHTPEMQCAILALAIVIVVIREVL